jgi:hypothetical protein
MTARHHPLGKCVRCVAARPIGFLGDFTSSTPQMNTRAQKKDGREGKTAYAIARDLNQDAVPTAQGCTRLVANYGPRAC